MFCLDLWFPLDCIRRKVVWCTAFFCLLLVFLLFAVFPFDVCALLCAYRQSIQFLRMADSLCLFVHIKTIYRFSFWVSPKKMMDEVNPFFLYYCNEISCVSVWQKKIEQQQDRQPTSKKCYADGREQNCLFVNGKCVCALLLLVRKIWLWLVSVSIVWMFRVCCVAAAHFHSSEKKKIKRCQAQMTMDIAILFTVIA